MKKTILFFCLIVSFIFEANSQTFNYQSAVRDNGGNLVTNQSIGVQIKILQGGVSGTVVYMEAHTIVSNVNGIINFAVGGGSTTDDFSTIDWSTQDYWLEIALDLNGGTTYTVIGSSQLLSVPYANYAINTPDADPTNEIELPTGGSNGQVLATDGLGSYSWVNQTLGDNLGNHTATTNITIGDNLIVNSGTDRGLSIDDLGVIKVISNSARPAHFESANVGASTGISSYIEVNNPDGTRALFGPDGNGFSGGDTNDVAVANWSLGDLTFFTNAAERMRIDSVGNVGIGKAVPNTKLNVNGTIRVDTGGIDVDAGGINVDTGGVQINGGGNVLNTYGANNSLNARIGAEYTNAGSFHTYNTSGGERFATIIDTNSDVGAIFVSGPNSSNLLVGNLDGSNDHGFIAVADASSSPVAGMYVDANGQGVVYGNIKNFRMPHPKDTSKEIWYASLEGPEAGAYARGSATLVNGRAVIQFPEHYKETVNEATITIHLTPNSGNSKGLAVVGKKSSMFQVQELMSGNGNYTFDWVAFGVRKGFEDYKVVRDKVKTPKMSNGRKSSSIVMPSSKHSNFRPTSKLFLEDRYEANTITKLPKEQEDLKVSVEQLKQEVSELKKHINSLLNSQKK